MRKRLLNEYGIEIGAGLGPFAGKAWRIGIMGSSCTQRNVILVLGALESILGDMGVSVPKGAAIAAASEVFASHLDHCTRDRTDSQMARCDASFGSPGGSCALTDGSLALMIRRQSPQYQANRRRTRRRLPDISPNGGGPGDVATLSWDTLHVGPPVRRLAWLRMDRQTGATTGDDLTLGAWFLLERQFRPLTVDPWESAPVDAERPAYWR